MPRLREPLKKQEDVDKVPLTDPVELELDAELFEAADGKKEVQLDEPEKKEKKEEPSDLKEQLAKLTKAEEIARNQAAESERQRVEAQRQVQERTKEVDKFRSEAEDAQYNSVVNAIGTSQAEIDSAKKDLKAAGEAGDWTALADAQDRLSKSNARLVTLEDGKSAFEARREELKIEAKNQKTERTAPQSDPVETHIQAISVNDREKSWLREHKDFLIEPRKNAKLTNAHYEAEENGHQRGSDNYFKFIEERVGLRQPEKKEETLTPEPKDTQRSPAVAAPVSRETPSADGQQNNGRRVTLTPEEREAARLSGIDEVSYAREKLKLAGLKKQGYYTER